MKSFEAFVEWMDEPTEEERLQIARDIETLDQEWKATHRRWDEFNVETFLEMVRKEQYEWNAFVYWVRRKAWNLPIMMMVKEWLAETSSH